MSDVEKELAQRFDVLLGMAKVGLLDVHDPDALFHARASLGTASFLEYVEYAWRRIYRLVRGQ